MLVNGAVIVTDVLIGVKTILATDNIPFGTPFDIQVDHEVMTVIANNASTFTVLRGQRGTPAAAHADSTVMTNITGKTATVPASFTDTQGNKILLDSSVFVLDSQGNLGVNDVIVANTDGTTVTFDALKGRRHKVTLAGSRTFVFANMGIGKRLEILITQDGTGSRTVTWPSNIRWAGGSAPTLTTTAAKTDIVSFLQIDSTPHYLGTVVGQNY